MHVEGDRILIVLCPGVSFSRVPSRSEIDCGPGNPDYVAYVGNFLRRGSRVARGNENSWGGYHGDCESCRKPGPACLRLRHRTWPPVARVCATRGVHDLGSTVRCLLRPQKGPESRLAEKPDARGRTHGRPLEPTVSN